MISIITAVKNGEYTLKNCLDSVASQSADFEHLLIDGSSTDRTLKIAHSHRHQSLSIFSEPDRGLYDAMNKGIRLASGSIIGILNADDIYYDNSVLEKVEKVFAFSNIQACYGDLVYVTDGDLNDVRRYWKAGNFSRERMYLGWMPPHPTFFVRRSVYMRHGLFNTKLGSAADYELMLRFLFKHAISTEYIPKILVKMRTGGVSNRSLRNRLLAHAMDHKAWQVNGLKPYPWTLLFKPIRKIPQFFFKPPGQLN